MMLQSILRSIFIDKSLLWDIKFLRRVSLFSDLPEKVLAELINISNLKHYAAGETIFEEGSVGKILYIIKSGEVMGMKAGKDIFHMRIGDYFGEMALLEEATRSVTIKAAQECELFLIYKVKFDGFLDEDPKAGVKILRNLATKSCERLRLMDEKYVG
ncbi:MAG: hypothetical protein A2293_15755 [Elusimicrobia bacterium RIFOXYB2_FULL_49_7]|nr:MAG: hypothetical protein A2293_15755 [Elusimicrobia bacterium RIFOXYB2_FULL_49_7]